MQRTVFFLIPLIFASCSKEQTQSITLSYEESIRIPVESVSIAVNIIEEGVELKGAEKSGFNRLSDVVTLLKNLGYSDDQLEINSGETSLSNFRDNPFRYRSSVWFDIYALDKLDTIRRSLLNAGISEFEIVSFNNSNENSIYNEAYQEAINSAKMEASLLLKSQNVEIGRILNLTEHVQQKNNVIKTAQPSGSESMHPGTVPNLETTQPLFNISFYTRNIEFTVEFELLKE